MKLFYLFGGKDFAVINLDGGILFDPIRKGRFGYPVFFEELGLGFSVLVKGTKGLFEIFIIFALCCQENTSFWCLLYCNV